MANFYAIYAGSGASGSAVTITSPIGQQAMATSVSVAIASNQSALPIIAGSLAAVALIRNDYSSVNVTSAAYTQLVAATAAKISVLHIFDSSGALLELAVGAAGFEVNQVYIFPGGVPAAISLNIPAGSRISVKSIDTATVSSGQLAITALG